MMLLVTIRVIIKSKVMFSTIIKIMRVIFSMKIKSQIVQREKALSNINNKVNKNRQITRIKITS